MDDWKYIYVEEGDVDNTTQIDTAHRPAFDPITAFDQDQSTDLVKKRGGEWESQIVLPPPRRYRPYATRPTLCDEDYPRIFHMFWTGPFTDKPYLALLSFLFTQNTGMHTHEHSDQAGVCRPQFWLWINPGPAASVPNPSALDDMYNQLKSSPWAAPFLHPRFKNIIHFKLWNTTEQLDGVPELKSEWRAMRETLFNSGGHLYKVPGDDQKSVASETEEEEERPMISTAAVKATPTNFGKPSEDDILNRTGSKSSSSYDRLSVILSDMARFVLCHRFGGIYLDADTIFLRDWEELWGWRGAFAYRWSRLEKYNTAVLKMNKNSALGTFLFRTALRNLLDFHPMTVARYTKDAHVEQLLLRLPDALFDSAWLNTEHYQRDRPAQPFFTEYVVLSVEFTALIVLLGKLRPFL
jgi:DDB1- and CUL4-associated factor 13